MLSPLGIMEVARMNGKLVVKKNNLIFVCRFQADNFLGGILDFRLK
jgi:hypothetical protein